MRYHRSVAEDIEEAHAHTEESDKGTEAVTDDCCAANDASEAFLVGVNPVGTHGTDVGGGADEKEHDDYHAVETEEGALSDDFLTIHV